MLFVHYDSRKWTTVRRIVRFNTSNRYIPILCFELIYADTDAVFLKKKDATKESYVEIMSMITKETGLDLTLEFHYKYLVLLHIEADEKLEAKKHYFGLTYDNQLVTRGIDTRRHDSPAFIKQFQTTLCS
jgi:DNA polymerase elongation subunit (family B)